MVWWQRFLHPRLVQLITRSLMRRTSWEKILISQRWRRNLWLVFLVLHQAGEVGVFLFVAVHIGFSCGQYKFNYHFLRLLLSLLWLLLLSMLLWSCSLLLITLYLVVVNKCFSEAPKGCWFCCCCCFCHREYCCCGPACCYWSHDV